MPRDVFLSIREAVRAATPCLDDDEDDVELRSTECFPVSLLTALEDDFDVTVTSLFSSELFNRNIGVTSSPTPAEKTKERSTEH